MSWVLALQNDYNLAILLPYPARWAVEKLKSSRAYAEDLDISKLLQAQAIPMSITIKVI